VRLPLCAIATLAAHLGRWPTGSDWPGIGQLFSDPQWRLTVRLPPRPPRGRGPDQQIQCWFRRILVLAASPLEALPLAPGSSLLFSGFSLQASWRVRTMGYWVACWLKPPTSRAGWPAFALALAGELRAGLVLMQGCPSGEERPAVMGKPADYQLRFFAPGLGISEDPVHRLSHALVAPWLVRPTQRRQVVGWQASARGRNALRTAVFRA